MGAKTKPIIGALIAVLCVANVVSADGMLSFTSTLNHMYTYNTDNQILYSGYYPDTPELQNSCSFFQGFFVQFSVDYSS